MLPYTRPHRLLLVVNLQVYFAAGQVGMAMANTFLGTATAMATKVRPYPHTAESQVG